jgi:hypothetical protein
MKTCEGKDKKMTVDFTEIFFEIKDVSNMKKCREEKDKNMTVEFIAKQISLMEINLTIRGFTDAGVRIMKKKEGEKVLEGENVLLEKYDRGIRILNEYKRCKLSKDYKWLSYLLVGNSTGEKVATLITLNTWIKELAIRRLVREYKKERKKSRKDGKLK